MTGIWHAYIFSWNLAPFSENQSSFKLISLYFRKCPIAARVQVAEYIQIHQKVPRVTSSHPIRFRDSQNKPSIFPDAGSVLISDTWRFKLDQFIYNLCGFGCILRPEKFPFVHFIPLVIQAFPERPGYRLEPDLYFFLNGHLTRSIISLIFLPWSLSLRKSIYIYANNLKAFITRAYSSTPLRKSCVCSLNCPRKRLMSNPLSAKPRGQFIIDQEPLLALRRNPLSARPG